MVQRDFAARYWAQLKSLGLGREQGQVNTCWEEQPKSRRGRKGNRQVSRAWGGRTWERCCARMLPWPLSPLESPTREAIVRAGIFYHLL